MNISLRGLTWDNPGGGSTGDNTSVSDASPEIALISRPEVDSDEALGVGGEEAWCAAWNVSNSCCLEVDNRVGQLCLRDRDHGHQRELLGGYLNDLHVALELTAVRSCDVERVLPKDVMIRLS